LTTRVKPTKEETLLPNSQPSVGHCLLGDDHEKTKTKNKLSRIPVTKSAKIRIRSEILRLERGKGKAMPKNDSLQS